jgi:hypothetical protein
VRWLDRLMVLSLVILAMTVALQARLVFTADASDANDTDAHIAYFKYLVSSPGVHCPRNFHSRVFFTPPLSFLSSRLNNW